MLEHAYCPRSVFCAFAHHDSELHVQRTPYYKSPDNTTSAVQPKQGTTSGAELSISPVLRNGKIVIIFTTSFTTSQNETEDYMLCI